MLSLATIRAELSKPALLEVGPLPWPRVAKGKVREIFDVGGDRLLMVVTDRLSAFDVIMPNGVPGKGTLLNQLSLHFFEQTADIAPNHLVPHHDEALRELLREHSELLPRSLLVERRPPLPVEAVVRGYLAGSGWKDYQRTGSLFGQPMPTGLTESAALPTPAFTPTTKAHTTGHDEPLSLEACETLLGSATYTEVLETSLALYERGVTLAQRAGLLLADTKFEFGHAPDGTLCLIDEVLTPDSSRYWPADQYQPGQPQPSYDKQYVRDYLESQDWDKTPPAPILPEEIIQGTQQRYWEALEKLVG